MQFLTLVFSCLILSSANVSLRQTPLSSTESQAKESSVLPESESRTDFGKLERKLMVLFPGSKIELIPLAQKVLVQGQVHNAQEAKQIRSIIRGAVANDSIEFSQPTPIVVDRAELLSKPKDQSTAIGPLASDRLQLSNTEHLRKAADHLEAAGLNDEAQRIRAQAMMQRQQQQLQRKLKELQKLQDQIRHLQKMTEIQQVVVDLKIIEVDLHKLQTEGMTICELSSRQSRPSLATLDVGKTRTVVVRAAGTSHSSTASASASAAKILDDRGELTEAGHRLHQKKILKIVATPSLVTVPDRPATLRSGGEFPVLIPESSGKTRIEYRDFGLRVETVTQVLANGKIRVELSPEIVYPDFSNAVEVNGVVIPGLTVRQFNTQVVTDSGRTAVIGSLTSQQMGKVLDEKHTVKAKGLILAVTPVLLASTPRATSPNFRSIFESIAPQPVKQTSAAKRHANGHAAGKGKSRGSAANAAPRLPKNNGSRASSAATPGTDDRTQTASGMIKFESIVVNLKDERLKRYLRIEPVFQVKPARQPAIQRLVEQKQIEIKNWMINRLADITPAETLGKAGQDAIRKELTGGLNALLGIKPDAIQSILFTEFNVQ